MCNLYTQTRSVDAMRQLFGDLDSRVGNLQPGEVHPDRAAPVLRAGAGGLVLQMARWGLPSPPQFHGRSGIDRGVTNVRNTASPHWRRWLGPAHRCLVPMSRFAEPRGRGAGNAWFAVAGDRPAFFAGILVPEWTSLRKLKDGETTDDLFAFLTCAPNALVEPVHPGAMPVILTEPQAWQAWLSAPWSEAKALQRPLAAAELELVEDAGPVAGGGDQPSLF